MRICVFGDSFVQGTGDDDMLGWPGRLGARARQAGLDLTLYNLGIRRETSADIASRWRAEADRRLPSEFPRRLAFAFGNNDCADDGTGQRRVILAETLANAELILHEASIFAPTLMIGPVPIQHSPVVDDRVRSLSQFLGDRCDRLGVPYIDVYSSIAAASIWHAEAAAGDGVHPSSGGYRILSDRIGDDPVYRAWLGG